MKLLKKIKKYFLNRKIQRRIDKAKYIHIMHNDKFVKPFVDFLNKNFDVSEHIVLCKRWCQEFPFPIGDNVVEIETLKKMTFNKNEKIICHSLFDGELVDYLYKHQDILKEKSYWMIWGGDLYNAPRDEINDYVRENFKGYITDVDGDIDVLINKYNVKNKNFYNSGYTFPVTMEMINDASKNKKRDSIVIQVNNSCDKSTLEMLDILSKFKNENIIIKTILSYGPLEYKDEIIKKGKQIFGNKFEYLDKILFPQEYANYISENNILILNQNRQQGLGNCFASLNFGQKVYIRSEISTFNHLENNGNKIFDTNKIATMDFSEFISLNEETKQNNIENSDKFFSDDYLKELWQCVFESEFDTLEYWHNPAKQFGKHSVYNMCHSIEELDSVDEYQQKIYKDVLEKYLTGNELIAVDFGCGVGRFEPMLATMVKEKVYGIEPISSLIKIASKVDKVEYKLLEDENIDLPDNSIDIVFVSLVLGGITNKYALQKTVSELQRIAKYDALFFIVENTAKVQNSKYWHYRTVEDYLNLFKPINLELVRTYKDVDEEISIMVGRKNENF